VGKFKAGDRVAVYGLDNNLEPVRIISTVTEVLPNGQLYLDEASSVAPKLYDFSMAHPKQCRKLKKRPRRRVWINSYPDGSLGNTNMSLEDARLMGGAYGVPTEFLEVTKGAGRG
jgi:hypothetical protein